MIEDFSKIYDKMLEEQTQKIKKVPLIQEKIHGDKNVNVKSPKEEPLEKFLLNLNEKLKQKLEEKKKLEEKIKESQHLEEQTKQKQLNETEEDVEQSIINDSEKDLDEDEENNLEDVENIDNFENFYIKELEKIDKSSSKKLIKENEDLTNQIQNLQSQITRLNVEAGTWGGGDIGGGGSGSKGGDGSCMCDRLVSGDQSLILNADGTLSLPNEQISTPTGLISVFGDLSASGRIYQNGNDLQTEIESISSVSNSVYTTVNTNSSNWVDVYTTFKNVSSTFLTSETDSQTLSFNDLNKNLTISNGNTVSLSSLMPDTSVRALTSNWESTYTTFKNTSSTFLTSETDSQTLSFNDLNKNLTISNGNTISLSSLIPDTSVRALTSNWQSTYTTVSSNSATWNYQGTDIKALTSGWVGGNQAYTNLISNSAAYLSGVNLSFLSVSGNWNSTYSTVQSNSATWNSVLLGTSEILIAEVKNAEPITLNRGDVVYAFGSTGNKLSVKLASNLDDSTSSKTIGIVNGTITSGSDGFITSVGRMDKLILGDFNDGDSLWLDSTAGDFTNVKPVAPKHSVFLGIVERANNGDGIAYIKIQNGYELNEIHDVLVTNVSAGDFLQRDSSNTLWIPVPLSANEWNLTYSIVQSNSSNWILGPVVDAGYF